MHIPGHPIEEFARFRTDFVVDCAKDSLTGNAVFEVVGPAHAPVVTELPASATGANIGQTNIATGSTSGDYWELHSKYLFDLSKYFAIDVWVNALIPSHNTNTYDFYMSLCDAANPLLYGAYARQRSGDNALELFGFNGSPPSGLAGTSLALSQHSIRDSAYRDFTLRVWGGSKSVALFTDNPDGGMLAYAENVGSLMNLGIIQPRISQITKTGASRSMTIGQFGVTLWRDR